MFFATSTAGGEAIRAELNAQYQEFFGVLAAIALIWGACLLWKLMRGGR